MKKFHLAYAHFMLINVFLQINWIKMLFHRFSHSDTMELHEENNRIRDSKKDCIFVCLFMFKSLYVDNSVALNCFI